MKLISTLACLFFTVSSYAVDFTTLSNTQPATTSYPANFKCYVDVSLFINTTEVRIAPVFLRVSYIIGTDTLTDNITVNGTFNKVVKQLFLDEGERLTAMVYLNNGDVEEIEGIEGSLRIVSNQGLKVDEGQAKNTFLSNVWKTDQTPLFRVAIEDSSAKVFRLKLALTENYEYDKLYFNMKVISPSAGIIMLSKAITVTDGSTIDLRKRTYTIDLPEVDLSTAGTYYFQVMHNMDSARINGVNKVNYEIVSE